MKKEFVICDNCGKPLLQTAWVTLHLPDNDLIFCSTACLKKTITILRLESEASTTTPVNK